MFGNHNIVFVEQSCPELTFEFNPQSSGLDTGLSGFCKSVFRSGFASTMPGLMEPAIIKTWKENTSQAGKALENIPEDLHLNDGLKQGHLWETSQMPGKPCCPYDEQQSKPQESPVWQGVFGVRTRWSYLHVVQKLSF